MIQRKCAASGGEAFGHELGAMNIARPGVRTPVEISEPDDPLEHEAERTAERVMRMPDAAARGAGQPERGTASGAQPLAPEVRSFFEPRFGVDFANVRVHADWNAERAARGLQARAFTIGSDIVFGAGEYRPHDVAGRRLLAHELTHVIQQGGVSSATIMRQTNPAAPSPPAAASVTDSTVKVLPADQTSYTQLSTFIQNLVGQIRALLQRGVPSKPWLTLGNANVQTLLFVLDQLVADLIAQRFTIRFNRPRGGAAYDFYQNIVELAPFGQDQRERTSIAIDLVHEYTHVLQDRAAETAFAQQRAPQVPTRESELRLEIGARRKQVYFADILEALGFERPKAESTQTFSDGSLRGMFEYERTAATASERMEGTQDIRRRLRVEYEAQITQNSAVKRYPIEISPQNHALLHWALGGRPTPVDLGLVPTTIGDAAALQRHLSAKIRALPEFGRLFNLPSGRGSRVGFSVIHGNRQVTEFLVP